MKTKILKKINKKVRIVEVGDSFVVEHNLTGSDGWHPLNTFSTRKAAIEKKISYIVMVIMRDLGYRNEFVKRRVARKDKKFSKK